MPNEAPTDEQITRVIAEKVMGWNVDSPWPDTLHFTRPDTPWTFIWNQGVIAKDPRRSDLFSPLTSIADAFMAVEKMRDLYTNINLHAANGWGLSFGKIHLTDDCDGFTEVWTAPINADTPARAISLAIYAALEGK